MAQKLKLMCSHAVVEVQCHYGVLKGKKSQWSVTNGGQALKQLLLSDLWSFMVCYKGREKSCSNVVNRNCQNWTSEKKN
jgi:hypothetical protein